MLGAVKTEFSKFEDIMTKMQGHLQQTSKDLDTLMGTRTRAINRKLREVQQLEEPGGAAAIRAGFRIVLKNGSYCKSTVRPVLVYKKMIYLCSRGDRGL